ncbi:hypothetical protein RUM43_008844 [Polyplax serrata]|uniref:Uncharacterized protein n=1 Tax=Polyplax serrata TaxID=468196 RepID=A0AAN8NUZ3_POLSC
MSFSASSNKPDFVNLKSIFGEKSTTPRRGSFSKLPKRRAPLPPTKGNDGKTAGAPAKFREVTPCGYSQITARLMRGDTVSGVEDDMPKLQIVEDEKGTKQTESLEKDFDLNTQLKELETIAKCYNNLKIKLEKSTNPFDDDDDYDESKNPFYEAEEEKDVDERTPCLLKGSQVEVSERGHVNGKHSVDTSSNEISNVKRHPSEIIPHSDNEQERVELRKPGCTASRIPKRTLSVNAAESEKAEFQRNGDVRHSIGPGAKSGKDRLSRTSSDGNRDPLETFKKPWTRVSAKFKREPLFTGNKGPGRGNNRPAYRKSPSKIQVGVSHKKIVCAVLLIAYRKSEKLYTCEYFLRLRH